jgi:hypothetical protein
MKTEILQNWVTVAGNQTVTYVVQDEEQWGDVADCPDVQAWIDVRAVTNSAYPVFVGLYTAPSKDNSLFTQAVPNVPVFPSQSPFAVQTLRGAKFFAPLAKWLRWRVSTPSPNSAWSATFRIRLARSRTAFFTPTQIPGCVQWLRSDVTPNQTVMGGAMSATIPTGTNSWAWADMSGAGNGPSFVAGTLTYNLITGGIPYIQSASAGNNYIRGGLAGVGSSHTYFIVANVSTPTTATSATFAATVGVLGTGINTAFSLWHNTTPSFVGRTSTDPAGTNADALDATSSFFGNISIITHDANNAAQTSHLWMNGVQVASQALTFTPGTPDTFTLFAQDGAGDNPTWSTSLYEVILYNRTLSAAELTLVHRYLGSRYGIAVP